jgi:transposase
MPRKKYIVNLTEEERVRLKNMISAGQESARKLTRARILLKADEGWSDAAISQALDVGTATVGRVRQRCVEESLEAALNRRKPRRDYERKLDGKAEAHLIALACSEPPAGYGRWTLRLLADELVKLEQVELDSISHEAVRMVLKKTNLNLGSRSNG